jgi:ubiquinone/menaquinone biosynthesis C-methylase UbiE
MMSENNKPVEESQDYAQRVSNQIAQYASVENMNVMSDVWHYWQKQYFLPRFREVMGAAAPFHLYLETFSEAMRRTGNHRLLSVGFGDGLIETRLIKELKGKGFADCKIDAVEISAAQIERGRSNAEKAGVLDAFNFIESDTNTWRPAAQYAGVMVHHALHHIQELEHFFSGVKQALLPQGRFVTFDVVGRNGHMRWPETLSIVQSLWRLLPPEKRKHHILGCIDESFVNRDCSSQGFEGIRAQDILPLLIRNFGFERFFAWGGLTDVFVSRGFGPNFDPRLALDKAFIDHVALLNDILVDAGHIKPTVIAAVMHTDTAAAGTYFRHWSPRFCVRPVLDEPSAPPEIASSTRDDIAADSGATTILDADLGLDETKRKYLPHIGEILHHETSVDEKVLETTDWYYGHLKGVVERNGSEFSTGNSRYLELACYRHIIGYKLAKDYGFRSTHFDICERDLLEGRSIALAKGFEDNVELVVGDYHSLPFADGAFDLVFISAAIHHSRVPERIISEAMRVLRDGGLFYCQREPARRSFCFYRFVGNRPHSHTAFERHLWQSGLIRTLSSPFPGARNSLLFGRIENDQIELDEYYEAFARWGSVKEEVVYHEGLLTPLDKEILAELASSNPKLEEFIATRLKAEFAKASDLLTERDKLLGHSVPKSKEIEDMARKVAGELRQLPSNTNTAVWRRGMGKIFGASLRFVVQKHGGPSSKPAKHLTRSLSNGAGVVKTDSELKLKSGLDFSRRLLPSLQDPSPFDWAKIFPVEHWQDINNLGHFASQGGAFRRRLLSNSKQPMIVIQNVEPCLLVLRAKCILPAHVRSARLAVVNPAGEFLCRNFYPQTEDQAVLAKLPAGRHELTLAIEADGDPQGSEPKVEITVCQLLAEAAGKAQPPARDFAATHAN